jgi:hypothetical protein
LGEARCARLGDRAARAEPVRRLPCLGPRPRLRRLSRALRPARRALPALGIAGGARADGLRRRPERAAALRCGARGGRLPRALGPSRHGIQIPRCARACADVCSGDRERERGATRPSLLLPAPLAAARLRTRGSNQAWEIAGRVARRLDVACDPALLLRRRETEHQLALPLRARAGNVAGAFAVEPRRRAELAGRHVAVVDDVMTTGSTAAEVARVLQQAGAATVEVWVLARTPRPDDA